MLLDAQKLISLIDATGKNPVPDGALEILLDSGKIDQSDLMALLETIIKQTNAMPVTAARELAAQTIQPETTEETTPVKTKTELVDRAIRDSVKADRSRSTAAASFYAGDKEGYNPILVRPCTAEEFFPGQKVRHFMSFGINGAMEVFCDDDTDPGVFQMDPRMGSLYAISLRLGHRWSNGDIIREGISIDKTGVDLVALKVQLIGEASNVPDHKFDELFEECSLIPKNSGIVLDLKIDKGTIAKGLSRMNRPKFGLGEGMIDMLTRPDLIEQHAQANVSSMKTFIEGQHEIYSSMRIEGFITIADFNKSLDKNKKQKSFKGVDGVLRKLHGASVTSACLWAAETEFYDNTLPLQMGPHRVRLTNKGFMGADNVPLAVKKTEAIAQDIAKGEIDRALEEARNIGDPATVKALADRLAAIWRKGGVEETGLPS